MVKKCNFCWSLFDTNHRSTKYCSTGCKRKGKNRNHRDKYQSIKSNYGNEVIVPNYSTNIGSTNIKIT